MRYRKKGFTLVELLISISIIGFIIALSYTLLQGNITVFNQKTSDANNENDIRILVEYITKDLKNTTRDKVVKNPNGYTINDIDYTLVQTGIIENRKVFKLVRQADKEGKTDLINSLQEGIKGFNIKMPSDSEPYYTISVTIIDKFNKDKISSFKVSATSEENVGVIDEPDTPGDYMITASPTVLEESSANNGSLKSNIITATLNYGAGNFDNKISKNDVIINGLPAGMDFTVTRTASKKLTIVLTGKAIEHSDVNDVNVVIIVKNTGFTGNSSHEVNGISNPVFIDFIDVASGDWQDCVIMAKNLTVSNGGIISAPTATIIVKDTTVNTVNLDGGTSISASTIYVNHNLDLSGSASIGNKDNSSSIYVNGNINLSGGTYIYKKLYYTGELNVPHWIDVTGTKVDNIEFPNLPFPLLQQDNWYIEKGFTSDSTAKSGMKYLASSSYTFPTWQNFSNVNVVSKGNISLVGGVKVNGILFAPNGTVTIDEGAHFSGLIVAKYVKISGGAKVEFEKFDVSNLPF